MREIKHFSVEMDQELYDKLRYIAAEEERSMVGQIKYLVRQRIKEFEKMDGSIAVPELKEKEQDCAEQSE